MEILIFISITVLLFLIYYLFFSPRSQIFGYFPYHFTTKEKVIALTFDDGPNPPFTKEILTILNRYNVKATFFVIGKNLEKAPELGKNILDAGHTIGNHSHSHAFHKYFTDLSFESEIINNQDTIERIINKRPTLFRPPWLFRQPWLLRTLRRNGLYAVSGLFGSTLEIFQPSAKYIARQALGKVRPGMILIFHDGYSIKGGNRRQTVDSIDLLIPKLLTKGYKFVTVDQLLGIPAYKSQ
jgi:peptidoglycan/xylan/chitin deacetylase (PgdA/CDA1 family)